MTQIGRTIARALGLNEDLTEAIGLGHDLGHTPFGHAGERALDEVLQVYGERFRHPVQSVRVVTELEKEGKGLNLTLATINGIEFHSKGSHDLSMDAPLPFTAEGCIVRLSDRIAYVNHDLDDALRGGLLMQSQIPKDLIERLGDSHGERVGRLVEDVVLSSQGGKIGLSASMESALDGMKTFLFQNVYLSLPQEKLAQRVSQIVEDLYQGVYNSKFEEHGFKVDGFPPSPRRVADWIAGMTDAFALARHREIYQGGMDRWGLPSGELESLQGD